MSTHINTTHTLSQYTHTHRQTHVCQKKGSWKIIIPASNRLEGYYNSVPIENKVGVAKFI